VNVVAGTCTLNLNVCGQSFGRKAHVEPHINSVHRKMREFRCNYVNPVDGSECGRVFANHGSLSNHISKHKEGNKFVCQEVSKTGCKCEKTFAQKYNLRVHIIRVHRRAKTIKCDFEGCKGLFVSQSEKRQHVRFKHEGHVQRLCIGMADESGCVNGGRNFNPDLRYGRRCVRCFVATFPSDPRAVEGRKWLNAKELAVREFLVSAFPDRQWEFDRGFSIGLRRRPDAKIVISDQVVIVVEVDEHSHRTYDCVDERGREELFASYAPIGSTIAIIRINPDAYECVVTGKQVPSCFRFSTDKLCVSVDPRRQEDWNMRMEVLKGWIQHFIDCRGTLHESIPDNVSRRWIVPIELFYDNVAMKWPNETNKKIEHQLTGKRRKRSRESM
jgi:hypothetical protein